MSAIESSSALFNHVCQLAETKITNHFKMVDESNDSSETDDNVLRIADLAEEVACELELKQPEALYSITMYLRFRPDLEVKSGKNGGIRRITDERTKGAMSPKECALKFYALVKECAPQIIDDGFANAEMEARIKGFAINKIRLNFQNLCDTIGDKLNVRSYAVYHCLKKYVEDERKDLYIALGRQGGLMRK